MLLCLLAKLIVPGRTSLSSPRMGCQHGADTVKAETQQALLDLCAAKKAGNGRAPAFLRTWLEQLGEAVSSTSLSR
ncbi:hypothetical protein WJX77_002412 [Trebouxia sp. C0004]